MKWMMDIMDLNKSMILRHRERNKVNNQRLNARGGYRRGGRYGGGDFHGRRPRDFPPTKERYTMKSEIRFSAPGSSMSGENTTMEPALAVERLT